MIEPVKHGNDNSHQRLIMELMFYIHKHNMQDIIEEFENVQANRGNICGVCNILEGIEIPRIFSNKDKLWWEWRWNHCPWELGIINFDEECTYSYLNGKESFGTFLLENIIPTVYKF